MAMVPTKILKLNRENITSSTTMEQWRKVLKSSSSIKRLELIYKEKGGLVTVPCDILHQHELNCGVHHLTLAKHVLYNIFPVYLSLNAVPMLLFKLGSVISSPVKMVKRAMSSAAQSSVFLMSLITSFQMLVCKLYQLNPDQPIHRFAYYIFGMIAGLSIFLEHPARRIELAMYVGPKALTSFYRILVKRSSQLI